MFLISQLYKIYNKKNLRWLYKNRELLLCILMQTYAAKFFNFMECTFFSFTRTQTS